jgi:hypothetical protein
MRRYAPCAMWWSFARIIADHPWDAHLLAGASNG